MTTATDKMSYRILILPLLVVATGVSFSVMLFGWNGDAQSIGVTCAVPFGYFLWILAAAALVEPRITEARTRKIFELAVSAVPGVVAGLFLWQNGAFEALEITKSNAFWLFVLVYSAGGTVAALHGSSLMGLYEPCSDGTKQES